MEIRLWSKVARNRFEIIDPESKIVEMTVEIESIGKIDVDGPERGQDEYVLFRRIDSGDIDPDYAAELMLSRVYRECGLAGGYFCNTVFGVNQKYSNGDTVILTIQHRFDI